LRIKTKEGPASNHGCPAEPTVDPECEEDSDGDGVPNCEDECPTKEGPVSNHGCPVE
jgi:OOP family OmpA-OmpF porin